MLERYCRVEIIVSTYEKHLVMDKKIDQVSCAASITEKSGKELIDRYTSNNVEELLRSLHVN